MFLMKFIQRLSKQVFYLQRPLIFPILGGRFKKGADIFRLYLRSKIMDRRQDHTSLWGKVFDPVSAVHMDIFANIEGEQGHGSR